MTNTRRNEMTNRRRCSDKRDFGYSARNSRSSKDHSTVANSDTNVVLNRKIRMIWAIGYSCRDHCFHTIWWIGWSYRDHKNHTTEAIGYSCRDQEMNIHGSLANCGSHSSGCRPAALGLSDEARSLNAARHPIA